MKWKILDSRELLKTSRSRIRVDRCQLPDGAIMPDYYVTEFPDWVNVVPITADGQVILVRQYRHGLAEVTLEVPGGAMDGEDGTNHKGAAVRELIEETGFTGDDWLYLGAHAPNPASNNNRMHNYLLTNCDKVAEQKLDEFERIEVVQVPLLDIEPMIARGEIMHSIVVATLYQALLKIRELHPHMLQL